MKKNIEKNPIYALRQKRGLTQKDIAEAIGTTANQISRLENGDRKLAPEWLERLSKALGCTKAELLGETPVLTPQDMALINLYNALPPEHQETILKLAKDMVALNSDGKKTASGS